jgi:vitamin K-dependent gamma-carboxylase
MKRHVKPGSRAPVSASERTRTEQLSGGASVEQQVTAAKFTGALWQPVDITWLVFLRVAFGSVMLWEVFRYFAAGRIYRYYIEPAYYFSYFGFEWAKPWPGHGMYIHFAVMGLLAVFITVGLFYRISALLFFMAFTWVFLLDQSNYLNHFYLVCLISFLMIFLPANRAVSLDARWGLVSRSETVPSWTLWLMRAQIGLVYFFGGIAKLNGDWLRGEPIREWLQRRSSLPALGPLFEQDWTVWLFAYGGTLFDLLIVPALLWKRTRIPAFIVAMLFHLTNAFVFRIGIFPWLMIAATTVFFDPAWPRKWLGGHERNTRTLTSFMPSLAVQRAAAALLVAYLAFQLLMPLRHWLYPGEVSWTEEGHRFSWRMKLRDKAGDVQFFVTDAGRGQTQQVNPQSILRPHQFAEMSTRPDMILQFAHHLAAEARHHGAGHVEVRAFVRASLNGRAPQLLIDPAVNLADVPRSLRHGKWIHSLNEPLRRPVPKEQESTPQTLTLP